MNNDIAGLIWQTIGRVILIVVSLVMVLLFKTPPSYCEKALWVGAALFVLTAFFNFFGLIEISDYLSVLGFVVITFALLRLFWSDSGKLESKDEKES